MLRATRGEPPVSPGHPSVPEPIRPATDEAELRDRIATMFAFMNSVVRRSAESAETVEDYAMHLEGRLSAIARGQDIDLRGRHQKGVDLDYLLAEELLAHGAKEGQQLALAGPSIELRHGAASLLGLALHELAVNAVKFGGLSRPTGHIAVRWWVDHDGDDSLRLQWHEAIGAAMPAATRRSGFGTDLIERTLAHELGAEGSLTFGEDWLQCDIEVPMSADVAVGQTGP
jgi:two-component system, chemotaxis family, CheB/CheR fusion protein